MKKTKWYFSLRKYKKWCHDNGQNVYSWAFDVDQNEAHDESCFNSKEGFGIGRDWTTKHRKHKKGGSL
jgi:hypothetical protein